jgi:hypothetical protein
MSSFKGKRHEAGQAEGTGRLGKPPTRRGPSARTRAGRSEGGGDDAPQRCDRVRRVALRANWRLLAGDRSRPAWERWPQGLCGWVLRGNRTPFGDEESISRDRERRVMVEASPAPTLIVIKADLLLEVLEVALDAPAEFCGIDKRGDRRVGGQGREPVSCGLLFALGSFAQRPFLRPRLGAPIIAMRGPHAQRRKA